MLVDGLGNGVCLEHPTEDLEFIRLTSFGMLQVISMSFGLQFYCLVRGRFDILRPQSLVGVLQGSRMRNTKTEFVSCPSCGRTLFDLQEVTEQIRSRTGHLPGEWRPRTESAFSASIGFAGTGSHLYPIMSGGWSEWRPAPLHSGVSIAIMGCIVNGPGEMADADFGYVGGAPGKIDLYVGKEVVKRGIPHDVATDALIQLIKDNNRWIEPEVQGPETEQAAEEVVVA